MRYLRATLRKPTHEDLPVEYSIANQTKVVNEVGDKLNYE